MHIVYVTGSFVEKEGAVLEGMQNYIYKISKQMIAMGNEITILTIGSRNKNWKYDEINVVSKRVTSSSILLFAFQKYVKYLVDPITREYIFNRELQYINKNKPIDIVQYAGWFGVGMLFIPRYPSVLRISTYVKEQLFADFNQTEIKMISSYEKMAARRFNGIISPSRVLGEKFSADVKRKVTVIETPFKIEEQGKKIEDEIIYRERLSDKKYILFFGRITADKGVDTIARAIHSILFKYPDIYFVLAGRNETNQKENLLKKVFINAGSFSNRVIYLGSLKKNQLSPVIKNAEMVVLPSLMDNLPNAGLEAMGINGIVIGTRGASFEEMIEDKVSGLLIEIDNEKDLEEKIDIVVNMSNEEKERMREKALIALDRFEPEKVGKKLLEYYSKIVKVYKRDNV